MIKQKRKAQAKRRQLALIGAVVLVGLVVVGILILQSPKTVQGGFVTVQPQTWPDASGKVLGPQNAAVVVQEFADFQCPYCRQFHDSILPQIISQYVATGKIRFEYHHFIVIDNNVGGSESRHAAEASECANEQGKFWDYFNMLFTNQQAEGSGAFSDSRLKAFAGAMGLDTAKFNACFDSHKYAQNVTADEALAASYRLDSTPSLLVNKTLVQNPLDFTSVKTAIDAALSQPSK